MIIERMDTYPLLFRITQPYGDANGYKAYRSCYLIKITTADGVSGWGECIDWLPTLDVGFKARIIPFLLGKNANQRNELTQVINKWHQRAASAVSMALLEIMAHYAKASICDLWGGKLHDSVPVYASFQSYHEREDWIEYSTKNVLMAINEGFQLIKVKIGGKMVGEDQKHIDHLLNSIGSSVQISLDANQSYDLSTALSWKLKLQSWKERGIQFSWLEEPLPLDFAEQYRMLRQALEIPLAGGENIMGLTKFLPLFAHNALDIVQPDCLHHAGIDEYRITCHYARSAGIRVSPHTYDGALSRYYAILAQACLPAWSKMEGNGLEPVEWDVMENPFTKLLSIKPERGKVRINEGIGLGVTVDEELLQAYLWDGRVYH